MDGLPDELLSAVLEHTGVAKGCAAEQRTPCAPLCRRRRSAAALPPPQALMTLPCALAAAPL